MKRPLLALPVMGALLVSGCAYTDGPMVVSPSPAPVYGPPAPPPYVLYRMRLEHERAAREEARQAELRRESWEARRQHRLWCEARGFRPLECR